MKAAQIISIKTKTQTKTKIIPTIQQMTNVIMISHGQKVSRRKKKNQNLQHF